ncbi:hypothetical protein C8J56DRAFT_915807 [Mycena floridula]|nr:hypothetical protein C8J56DRAFT_915807 [Mycena floridula]
MDEIIPGLWIGDLPSALDVKSLKDNKIFSILSAMRGKITVHETFIRHQILLDDTAEADILAHFLPSITFIQSELDKGRGVLVHCQAGMSRSATIVAAYLMYSQKLDPEGALALIRKSRPNVDPNAGFLVQLEIFHKAAFRISRRDKATRMFYLTRAVEEVMNGDGSLPETDMFAKYPRTPSDSTPATPGGPRRRIRCKMCRQELATREHMLDHGQLGPATPAAVTPTSSRRPSTNQPPSRRPSQSQPRSRLGSSTDNPIRRPSLLSSGLGDSLKMSSMSNDASPSSPRRQSSGDSNGTKSGGPFGNLPRNVLDSLSMSALESDDDDDESPKSSRSVSALSIHAAERLGRKMSDAVVAQVPGDTKGDEPLLTNLSLGGETDSPAMVASPQPMSTVTTPLTSSSDFAAQLHANPKLAALKSPLPLSMTPIHSASKSPFSPPILANPKCSGYFVEPMKWMEPFLEEGQIAGKILCPNKKCGAKLGNYDWAGVCCGCKEWVIPGFCINRSKVDEIV